MKTLSHEHYTVGWICALPLETAAAKAILDEPHAKLPQPAHDHNVYTLGTACGHNVVIACLPSGVYGTTSAATVATQMLATFTSIRFGLMVGIGGGVPSDQADIRLGDIVVSKPTGTSGGVVQYDYGKTISGGAFERTGALNKPPQVLLSAIADLQSNHMLGITEIPRFLSQIAARFASPDQYTYQGKEKDQLFEAEYDHIGSGNTCDECDEKAVVMRKDRKSTNPQVHYGLIASGNRVIKHSKTRDRLAREHGIVCFEMEAAGLMDHFPCLVIRGICDYSDSHKNKNWQPYAAAVAAAYAKELLTVAPVGRIEGTPTAREVVSQAESTFHIPFDMTDMPASCNFIGRDADLNFLWHSLSPKSSKLRKVVFLHGPKGIGKTQLAMHFARVHKDDFSGIVWLNARDRNSLTYDLASVLPRTSKESKISSPFENNTEMKLRADEVLKWLAMEGNSKWLLIYDNLNHSSSTETGSESKEIYTINEFLPNADHGSVIVTTHSPPTTPLGEYVVVERVDAEDAKSILADVSGIKHENIEKMIKSRKDLGRDCLPLAINLAGSFIRHSGASIYEYLEQYEQILGTISDQPVNTEILTIILLSQQWIKKRYPLISNLLALLCLFDNQNISFDLLEYGTQSPTVPGWFSQIASSKATFLNALEPLIHLSLVETKKDGESFSIHSAIQECYQSGYRQVSKIEYDNLRSLALYCVASAAKVIFQKKPWDVQRRLVPHMNQIVGTIDDQTFVVQDLQTLQAMNELGNLFQDQKRMKEAEIVHQRALAGYELALGPNNTSTLLTLNHLGVLYFNYGRLQDSEGFLKRALVGFEMVLGVNHSWPNFMRYKLGILYWYQGELEKAERMFEGALVGYETSPSVNQMSILLTLNYLGSVYRTQGKLQEAGQMYQRALAGYEMIYGPANSSTLSTVNNLGLLYQNQGRFENAEKMYQRALTGYEQLVGSDHTSTLEIVSNLGLLYRDQGMLAQAEEMFERALTGYRKSLGPEHTSILRVYNNLGLLYRDQGKLIDAEIICQQALTGFKKVLGMDHITTLLAYSNLGSVYSYQGKLDQAEDLCKRALAGFEKALSSTHIWTLLTVFYLGCTYQRQNKLKDAEEMLQRALTGFEQTLGPGHLNTLNVVHNLGKICQAQNEITKAEEMFQRALSGIEMACGPNSPFTLQTTNSLGFFYWNIGKPEKAEEMYRRALSGYETTLGPDHGETQLVANRLRLLTLETNSVAPGHNMEI